MIRVPDFDALYRDEGDPWRVGSSFYEQRKLDLLVAALSRSRYGSAWDPACGTGHLAARLASRCDAVLATDSSLAAVRLAEATCASHDNVRLERRAFPQDGQPDPRRRVDLLVLSEFLYYLDTDERAAIGPLIDKVTAPRAEIQAVHWRHEPHDAWLSGVAVQQELADTLAGQGWRLVYRIEDLEFDLAGWRRGADGDDEDD